MKPSAKFTEIPEKVRIVVEFENKVLTRLSDEELGIIRSALQQEIEARKLIQQNHPGQNDNDMERLENILETVNKKGDLYRTERKICVYHVRRHFVDKLKELRDDMSGDYANRKLLQDRIQFYAFLGAKLSKRPFIRP